VSHGARKHGGISPAINLWDPVNCDAVTLLRGLVGGRWTMSTDVAGGQRKRLDAPNMWDAYNSR